MHDANDCFEICGPASGQPLAPELPQGPAPAGRERCRAGLGAGEAARRLRPQCHEHAGAAGGGAAGGRRTARRCAAHGEGRARSGPGAAPAPAAGDVPRPRAGAGLERGARGRRGAGAPRERSRDRRARPPDGPSHGGSARAPDPRPARAGRSALAGAAFRAARGLARPRARGPRRRRPRAARALEAERPRPRRASAHARVPPRGGRVHAGDRRPQGGERPGRAGRRDDRAPARGQVVKLQPQPIQELQRLFHIPLRGGVMITAFDVLLSLALPGQGVRRLEAFIIVLVVTIGSCFAVQMAISRPEFAAILNAIVPRGADGHATLFGHAPGGALTVLGLHGQSLFVAMGILGATVMPHNLYLHSALVQSREIEPTVEGKREACRLNFVDSAVALNAALFVNGAILVLSAAAFHRHGFTEVASLSEAHRLLAPLLGSALAPTLFAIALLCSGQASTVTGTLAGQIVLEGFLRVRVRPWLRRLVSRGLAIIPPSLVIMLQGH